MAAHSPGPGEGAATAGPRETLDELLAERVERRRRRRLRRRLVIIGSQVGLLLVIFEIWDYFGNNSKYWRAIVETPGSVWRNIRDWLTNSSWWLDVAVTLQEMVIGYVLGAIVALVLVAIVIPIPAIDRFLNPFIAALNAVPKLLLYPLFIVWFGLGSIGKQYFVASVIFPILFYGVYAGLRSIDVNLINNARVLGASTFQLVRTVYIPAIGSWLLVSMRVAIGISLLSTVIAEYLGSFDGIGRRIADGQSAARSDIVLAAVFFVAVIALVFDRILVRIQRRYTGWSIF